MKKLHIAINTRTKVTQMLQEKFEVTYHQEQTFWEKILLKEKKTPDLYFHQGSINTKALDMIENSRLTIVNSNAIKELILEKRNYFDKNKIIVLYPYLVTDLVYDKNIKKQFRLNHGIEKGERIIYFSSKDLIQGGVDKFLEIVSKLERPNWKILIDTENTSRSIVQEKLDKYQLSSKAIVLENHENKDELFIASDIFILPTKQKLFAPSVLKAMYFKNAVFVNRENAASEIIDSFSLILGTNDQSVPFKVDALLGNKEELKKIQKENHLVVKNITFENYMQELEEIIELKLFDI